MDAAATSPAPTAIPGPYRPHLRGLCACSLITSTPFRPCACVAAALATSVQGCEPTSPRPGGSGCRSRPPWGWAWRPAPRAAGRRSRGCGTPARLRRRQTLQALSAAPRRAPPPPPPPAPVAPSRAPSPPRCPPRGSAGPSGTARGRSRRAWSPGGGAPAAARSPARPSRRGRGRGWRRRPCCAGGSPWSSGGRGRGGGRSTGGCG
mmetsp:Transcript_14208/g.30411  ORF Transcript_14208/g.30411 Transcript_14208/m.30411 type:complete len:206 (+) Transcript_14208:458-1075(+)